MALRINRIKPQVVALYDPEDNYLGDVNEYEFNDFRLRLVQNELTGYYIKFQQSKYEIDKYGTLNPWPKDLFTEHFILGKIIKAQGDIRRKEFEEKRRIYEENSKKEENTNL